VGVAGLTGPDHAFVALHRYIFSPLGQPGRNAREFRVSPFERMKYTEACREVPVQVTDLMGRGPRDIPSDSEDCMIPYRSPGNFALLVQVAPKASKLGLDPQTQTFIIENTI
jgi:hypothetical protein